MARLTGWRFGVFVGALFGSVGIGFYFVAIAPYYSISKWR